MCGIAGIISPFTSDVNKHVLKRMSDSLIHRGPDGEGYWMNEDQSVAFAHRRLAINDLSDAAGQPMQYLQRYTIIYNGELYNYIELKKDLQKLGYRFDNASDTEVILASYDCYGENCLHYFDGAFAFAIWDEKEKSLFAARDRFGEKPFYYFNENKRLLFASEMKALWTAGVNKTVDERMLLNYIALGYVQNQSDKSQTFFKDIYALPPAHYLTFCEENLFIEKYWNLDKQNTIEISEKKAIEKLDQLLSHSVSTRMRCDVQIGLTLSGGLDSSSILHYMHKQEKKTYKTISAVFPGFEKDEIFYIDKVNQHFQTDSFLVYPQEYDLIDLFEKISYHQEEPVNSSGVYAQYCVFKKAHQQGIKVLLDGQGADESLAGYTNYIHWYLQELLSRNKFSKLISEKYLLKKNGIPFNWGIKNWLAAYMPSHVSIALEKKEFNKIVRTQDVTKDLLGCLKGSEWEGIHKPVVTKLNDILHFNFIENGLEELLRYSDRNSMANSCEVRLPFLNHELVSFIFSLPSKYKISQGFTKRILRQTVNNHLPKEVVWKTEKVGFEPPQKKWMSSDIMQQYLHESKRILVDNGILKQQVLQKKKNSLDAYDSNNFDWRYISLAQVIKK